MSGPAEGPALEARPRRAEGSRGARRLRRQGLVPGVLYGPGLEPQPIAVEASKLRRVIEAVGESGALRLTVEGRPHLVFIREVQVHPIRGAILHVDFYAPRAHERVVVPCPLEFVGRARGVERGGLLEPLRRELEVRCLPTQVPKRIQVEVGELDIGDTLHAGDLRLPPGVELAEPPDTPLVTIAPPEAEGEEEAQP